MANSSASSGYLTPTLEPIYDEGLDDVIQGAIVGITGIPGSLVRPRWQPSPPIQPGFDVDWCAFGITRNTSDTFAYEKMDPTADAGAGSMLIERDELLYVLHSFYGPRASLNSKRLRSGLEISQNRDVLRSHKAAVVEVEESVTLPALLQEKWVRRVDTQVVFRRRTQHLYSILTVESGELGLNNGLYVTPITVTN